MSRADLAAREDAAAAAAAATVAATRPAPLAAGSFEKLRAKDLTIDSERFQFKKSDARGKTGRLANVERWDPAAAGVVTVWRDAKGVNYVVDGHQRVNLAHELESRGHPPIEIDVRVLDGAKMSAKEARLWGARLNIGQDSASAVDAANVLREVGAGERAQMRQAFKGAVMRQGAQLAQLADRPFELYRGHFYNAPGGRPALAPNLAAVIGEIVPAGGRENAEALQVGILRDMLSNPPANELEAREFVKEFVALAAARPTETEDLFGAEQIAESALRERAQIKAGVLSNSRRFRRIFASVAQNQSIVESVGANRIDESASLDAAGKADLISFIIDKEADRAGSPIAEALNRLAMQLKNKEIGKNEAINALYETITQQAGAVPAPGEDQPGGGVDPGKRAEDAAEEIERLAGELGMDEAPAPPPDNLTDEMFARLSEIEEMEEIAEDLTRMTDDEFGAYVPSYTGALRELAGKQRSGVHLTATERVLLARLSKLRPLIVADLKRRKAGGTAAVRKTDTDLARALAFLESTDEDFAAEGLGSEADIASNLGADTTELLDRGIAAGIPAAVTQDQASDAAGIVEAFKEGRGAFVLALDPGSGKTYVLAAALRELRRLRNADGSRRVNKIVYVTTSRPLIDQNEADFSPFMAGVDGADVEFLTYSKVSQADDPDVERLHELMERTRGAVLVMDESHRAKGQGSDTARALKKLMEEADFTVASSATPFTDPKDIHYIEPSGAFERLGGFEDWAKAHGVKVTETVDVVSGERYRSYSAEGVTLEDIANARRSMTEAGIFSYRPSRIDPERTVLEFHETEIGEISSPGMKALYASVYIAGEAATRSLRTRRARSNAQMWVRNKLKRISEQAKIAKAIEIAEATLEAKGPDKPQVIVFTETRSPTTIGEWHVSENYQPNLRLRQERSYGYPEMERMQQRAEASDEPLPFAPAIFELAREFHSLGIRAELPSVIDAFKRKFGADMLEYHGDVDAGQRTARQKAFNEGKAKVMVATVAAGGTGLSLHDLIGESPRTVVMLSMPWDAINFKQALGRATRYGMKTDVKIAIPYASNLPVDEIVAARQAERAAKMGLLIAGRTPRITGRIAQLVGGEEELRPASEAGPLKRHFETKGGGPRDYTAPQKEIASRIKRILRLGAREGDATLADVTLWLDEAGDAAPLDADELDSLERDGLSGFLRVQRVRAMIAAQQMVEAGSAPGARRVIGDLESYLATRPSSDYKQHLDDYMIDVKGVGGTSLADTLAEYIDQVSRNAERHQIVRRSRPKRGIERHSAIDKTTPAWRYLGDPTIWRTPSDDPAVEAGLGALIAELTEMNERMLGGRADLQVARGLFPAGETSLVAGTFNIKSSVMRVVVDPFYGIDSATREAMRKDPEIMRLVDPKHTLTHETVHALRKLGAIPDGDWTILERAVASKGWITEYNIASTYSAFPPEIQVEEAIAHKFADYGEGAEVPSRVRLAFDRIAEFFLRVFALARGQGYATNARAEIVFRRILGGGYAGAGGGARKPPVEDADPLSELPETPRNRWRDSRMGIEREGDWRRYVDAGRQLMSHLTSAFPDIEKTPENAMLLHRLRMLRGAAHSAGAEVADSVRLVTDGLSQADIWKINDQVVIDNLIWTYQEGKDLPFDIAAEAERAERDPMEVLVSMQIKADALIDADETLRARAAMRADYRDDLRRGQVDAGVLTPESARNPSYYRHQVMEHARTRGAFDRGQKVRSPRVHQRLGSIKDINLHFHQVEAEWMVKAKHDISVREFLNWLEESDYNVAPEWALRARSLNEARAYRALLNELRRAGWRKASHPSVGAARTPAELRRAATRLGGLPRPVDIPMFTAYANLAGRLAANGRMLGRATEEYLSSPRAQQADLPRYMRDLMHRISEDNWFEDRMDGLGEAAGDDFPAFEVAQWALAPASSASPEMKSYAAAFLKAAVLRTNLMKTSLVGKDFIDTRSRLAVHRAFDKDGGYRAWQPDAVTSNQIKLTIRTGKSIEKRAYEHMVATLSEEGDVPREMVAEWVGGVKDERMLGAPSKILIIPAGLADTLDEFNPKQVEKEYLRMAVKMNQAFRRWVLFTPRRVVGFNLRNTAGDLDAWLLNQSIDFRRTLFAHLPAAWRMLREQKRTGAAPQALKDAMKYDVLQSSYMAMQVGKPGTVEPIPGAEIDKVGGNLAMRAGRGYARGAYGVSRFRENAFRLAAYLNFREKFAKAGMVAGDDAGNLAKLRRHAGYGATARYKREGMAGDPDALAAQMARDAMGDYSDISAIGERLDRGWFFFWRWVETNTRRNYNSVKNAYQLPWDTYKFDTADKRAALSGLAKAMGATASIGAHSGAKMALRAAFLYTKFAMFASALALLSGGVRWVFWDDEDRDRVARRPERGRTPLNPKLTLFRDGERDAYVEMRYDGAFRDALRWVSIEDAWFAGKAAHEGSGPWSDVAIEMAKGPVKVPAGNLNGIYKALVEGIIGKRLWPDPFEPLEMYDPAEHVMRSLALDHEYRFLVGDEDAGEYARSWGLAAIGAVSRSAVSERAGADWEARRRAERAMGAPQMSRARQGLRRALAVNNGARIRKATIALYGLGLEYPQIAESVFRSGPAQGARREVREFVFAERATRGETTPAETPGQLGRLRDYWRDNPLTPEEMERIREQRRKWTERRRLHLEAARAELADAA